MSSTENNCIENCITNVCQGCTDACTERCEGNCQDACDQACENACNQACSNACSDVTCRCGPSTLNLLFFMSGTIIIPFFSTLILGIFQAFDPRGPLWMTIFGSIILAINLSGIKFGNFQHKSTCNLSDLPYTSKFGFIKITHSHHPKTLISEGHELLFKGRYFCTGCYGLLIGTLLAILVALGYLSLGLAPQILPLVILLIPICYLPIILRYSLGNRSGTIFRFISNALLPVGSCFLFIAVDFLYHDWMLNTLTVLFVLFLASLRGLIGAKSNKFTE